MIDEPKIEPCPMCKDESNIPFVYYYNQVVCPKCYLQGPRGDTAIAGICAWNQMALKWRQTND